MTTTPKAVLFDFSGTLFRLTAQPEWFAGLHDDSGNPLSAEHQAQLIRRLTQPVGLPADISDDDRSAWERRDLDPALHLRGNLAVLRASGLTAPGQAESLYQRVLDPASWLPFPDTAKLLRELHARGIPVGIVSNIAFDLRAVFARHDLLDTVGAWALSYEVGAIKPNPQIFHAALGILGVAAGDALMIGDSEEADGGSRRLGCAFAVVHDIPGAQRPTALLDAVAAYNLI
ncbi:MAG: HAD-IA family hydrolase [Gordonia sp. (in: high G+C Gram-positive bacteria)]